MKQEKTIEHLRNTTAVDKEKITERFGKAFLEKALQDLSVYSDKWELYDIKQIDYYSINCLFTCQSRRYGSCVLKIGKPNRETDTEYHALVEFTGTRFCKVYEADIKEGILLIERIEPGTQLRAVRSLADRLDIFCDVFGDIHKPVQHPEYYPSYLDWVTRIADYMRKKDSTAELSHFMTEAEQLCRELCEQYNQKCLLHGDLHHDNIMLGNHGEYRVIDPKGVIGAEVFDIPRFILNEFEEITEDSFTPKYDNIIQTLSQKLLVPEMDIRRLVYIETCMANCWNVEDGGVPDMTQVYFTRGRT